MTQALENPRPRALHAVGSRIPPHDLDAEESLLGAMLLSRDAIAAASESCVAEDFYKPAHGHIFGAVTALYVRGEAADPVTVADELRRSGLLDAVGDASVLTSLQVNTPSTANASHYARIVEEHALLRRLVAVAGEIAELGYSLPEDVSEVVDRAEAMVFDVAQRRIVDTMSPLRELLANSLDHLENLYNRGDTITGVPTGYTDLDEQLAGLQKSNLVVVGARPAMGKALSLDTPLPTPTGWTTMGEVATGDKVFDDKGRVCRVDYTSPVFVGHRCYEVRFDDGSTLVADAGHRWLAYNQSQRLRLPGVVTTEEMLAEGIRAGDQLNWHVPVAEAFDGPELELPVDPYVFGCWLGGNARAAGSETTIGAADAKHFRAEFENRGYLSGARFARQMEVSGPAVGAARRIPAPYLRTSFKQRLDLLQGIMDSAGTVTNANGTVEICLSDRELVEQVRELVCSLGHKPHRIVERQVACPSGNTDPSWRFHWSPIDPVFRLQRKAMRLEVTVSRRRNERHTRRAVVAIVAVPTVPVRCISVSSPSHLFLAGRSMIPTHNTSFALGIVAHAAVNHRVPVLLFSLEMSHLELTQRLLCSEAKVDATRMRNGSLLDSDWGKISTAIGRLGDAPIYIDDNPNITVMDIRAKARRLKASQGLGLVVVDYLQLMSGHSRSRAENRQVEVSEISRGLKVLARELDIPVVALSQLSRNLEMRQDKRPVLADLRESGCLTADTRVSPCDSGAEVTLGELFDSGERNIPVWALDESLRMVPATMTYVFSSGVKPTFELVLGSGKRVQASANHPFRTVLGWRRVDELQVGDRLATPRALRAPTCSKPMAEAEIVMLAHMLGDGCFASRQPIHYTSADEANLRAVEEAACHFGISPRRVVQATWTHVYLPAPYRLARGRRNPIVEWLDTMGLRGLRSYEKFIPDAVFSLDNQKLALFLRHIWATDGCLWWKGTGQIRCYYGTSSLRLARDIQAALLRFGIVGRIRQTKKGDYRPNYQVQISGSEHLLRFIEQIGVHGRRGEGSGAMADYLRGLVPNTNIDVVPREIWAEIKDEMQDGGWTHRTFSSAMGWQYAGSARYRYNPSRPAVRAMAAVLESPQLQVLADSDVFWDEIVAIEAKGSELVYDATVLEHHNFVANGVVAHNSIEQDSDVVMFIYRDEIYHADSADRGKAEIIVAKHRNGPTGVSHLAFVDRHTRFENMSWRQ